MMALAAMASPMPMPTPICWSGGIGAKRNAWIRVAMAGRASRSLFGVGIAQRRVNESWSRDLGGRKWRQVTSSLQSDDVSVSVEGSAYEETETEEEARTRNWKERGWAPWEELRTPEAQFAVDSLEDGEEEPVIPWEDFQKLNRKQYYEKLFKELEEEARQEEEERLKPDSLSDRRLVFTLTPPRDWPPPGWKVDAKELAYIREAHTLVRKRVTPEELDEIHLQPEGEELRVPRWEMFLKQYDEWVAANKDALDREAREVDGEYYPGRRRTGEEYVEGMYELPFIYPGQHYWGVVTYVNLYEGALVYFGGVHDGWVPIRDNDWYEIRKHIKVGHRVHVEVMAKRDPYRFRFPVELRFVDPNIDHLIFRRFKHPPIFGRKEDINLDEVARESGRPYFPKLLPEVQPGDDESVAPVHPYVKRLWVVHEAERMTLEDNDGDNEWDDWATTEEDDPTGEWANEPGILHSVEDLEVPTIVLHVEDKDMDLEAARAEKEVFSNLRAEAEANGEEFQQPEGRFERRLKELNDAHQQRWTEQYEALNRDRACRVELGLPLEEPGRYADKSFWGTNPYDPREPQWRHDYWGDPSKLKDELRKEREPRARPEEPAEVDDDFVDEFGGDLTTQEEGVELISDEEGFIYDDPDARIILGEPEDRRAVNGTAAKSLANIGGTVDVEEDDWNFGDNSESGPEGNNEGGDEPTNDKN
ncbi:unnamed protein product [Calypogeia fissa]